MPEASSALISEANSSHSPSGVVCRVQYSGQMPKRSRPRTTRLPLLVPQGDGELAAQVVEHPFLVVFPEVRDHLGVAVGGEAMAAAFQLGLHARDSRTARR